jgi:iron complex outermembrane recepter protein
MAGFSRIPQTTSTVAAAVLAVLSASAHAADTPSSSSAATNQLEEVVVTGSFLIRGGESGALPIRVLSDEDLARQGNPPLIDVLRALPEAAASIGNSNSSQPGKGQGFEGAESVNLRGLGPDRNLVLLNGKRLPVVGGFFVNTRHIPMAAIERIEVLKDAAATTYGSDAVTGVVNFITKRNFDGLEIGGDFTAIEDSDGDYTVDATWGKVGDGWNVMLSGGYQHRSRLWVRDRPWSTPPYSVNPDAGWNFSSMPSQFIPVGPTGPNGTLAAVGPRAVDVGCSALGGIQPFAGFCVNNVQLWQNLVAPADTYQLYGEFNREFGSGIELHVEATYAKSLAIVDYPPTFNQPKPVTETVLPANMNTATALAGTTPRLYGNWFVPITNPGLAAYRAANPSQFPANATGVFIPIGQWRPFLVGGNPFFGDDPLASAFQRRDQEQYRVSAGLKGKFDNGINWDANVTWGQNQHYLLGFDQTGVETQLALRGLGGPNCRWQTAAPGSTGCLWLNPMSTAVASAPINGVASNPGYVPSTANSHELANWLMRSQERFLMSTSTEANLVFNGALGDLKLSGGEIRWAAGAQFRRLAFAEHQSEYADRTRVPCLNSPLDIPNADVCTPTPYTPLGLAVALTPVDITTNVYAAFVEANLPITATADVTLGARFEDYGDDGGSTFDPKISAKWQALDWLALRGSASTSFRAPPQTSIAPNPAGSIPTILGQPRALDLIGNPDLEPETATVFSVGLLVQAGGFDAALDYYNYRLEDVLTSEPQNAVVNALFPNGAAGPNNCTTLDAAFIAAHFEFTGVCSAANLSKVKLLRINGPEASFDGLDLRATYTFQQVLGGQLQFGVVANRTLSYEFDPFTVAGLNIPGFEGVGKLNAGTLAHTLPKTKGQAYANYGIGPVNLRWTARYYSSYIDQRQAVTAIGYKIDSQTLHDFAAVAELPRNVQLTLAVGNVFDDEPPLVRVAEGYDAMTTDPLGRYYRVGLRMSF